MKLRETHENGRTARLDSVKNDGVRQWCGRVVASFRRARRLRGLVRLNRDKDEIENTENGVGVGPDDMPIYVLAELVVVTVIISGFVRRVMVVAMMGVVWIDLKREQMGCDRSMGFSVVVMKMHERIYLAEEDS